MFYYLSGTLSHIGPYLAVIDCGGVGYACKTTNYTLGTIKKGEKVTLYTHMAVSQDNIDLYGFSTLEEKNLFLMLISVSGVGPKAGLSILSTSTPSQLALSIITGDAKTLTAAPGIGKKIAQRIILELKDKLAKEQEAQGFSPVTMPSAGSALIPEDKVGEAAAALAVLGYNQSEINQALKGIDTAALKVEDIIKQALKRMALK